MTPETSSLVNKVWGFCSLLRNDGPSYGEYLEQITCAIFLKMAHEYVQPPHNRDLGIPGGYDWASLASKTGAELDSHYNELLRKLGQQPELLGQIFVRAKSHIQEPANLASLIALIDKENWLILGADVKGDIYEGLLERNAQDTKSGAGPPRPLR